MAIERTYNPFTKKLQKIASEKNFYFDATVGIGGDYPAVNGIKMAIADKKYNLKIISDLTENDYWEDLTGKVINLVAKQDFTITFNFNKIAISGSIYCKNLTLFDNANFQSNAIYLFENTYFYLQKSNIKGSNKRNLFLKNGIIDGDIVNVYTGNYTMRIDCLSNIEKLTFVVQNTIGNGIYIKNGNIGLFHLNFAVNYPTAHSVLFIYNTIIFKFKVTNSQEYGYVNIFEKTQIFSSISILPTLSIQTDNFVVQNSELSVLIFDDASPYYSGDMNNYNIINCKINEIKHRIGSYSNFKNGLGYSGKFESNKIFSDLEIWGDEISVQNNIIYGKLNITNEADKAIIDGNRFYEIVDNGTNSQIGITNTYLN